MRTRASELDDVVEGTTGLCHGDGTDGLAHDYEEDSDEEDEVLGEETEEGYGGGELHAEDGVW